MMVLSVVMSTGDGKAGAGAGMRSNHADAVR